MYKFSWNLGSSATKKTQIDMPTSSDLNTDKPTFLELISQFLELLVSLLDSYQVSIVHPPVEAKGWTWDATGTQIVKFKIPWK